MNNEPTTARLQHLLEKKKTVCFGRFLIDVPEQATVVWGRSEVPLGVVVIPGKASEVQQRAAAAEAKTRSKTRVLRDEGKPLYERTEKGPLNGQLTVVSQQEPGSFGMLRLTSYYAVGNDLVSIEALPVEEDAPSSLKLIGAMAERSRPLGQELPHDPGQCVETVFIADPAGGAEGDAAWQWIQLGFRFPELPDTSFSVELRPATGDPKEALDLQLKGRDEDGRSDPLYQRQTILRRGEHSAGEFPGFENLTRWPDEPGMSHPYHEFEFISPGVKSNVLKPLFDIQMHTGVAGNAAGARPHMLSDAEAVELWDRLLGSIRVRTNNGNPTAASGPHAQGNLPGDAALFAATGRACPRRGWWQCADEGEVQGGRHQFFNEGDRMPHVVLLGKPTAWQKLRGEQPQHRLATVWQYVGDQKPGAAPADGASSAS